MKRIFLFMLVLCFWNSNLSAKPGSPDTAYGVNSVNTTSCPTGDVTFTSQQEVDDFALNYPNCTILPGSLYVGSGGGNNNISSLAGLSQLISITGNLIVKNTMLTSFNGLNNLTEIEGDFELGDYQEAGGNEFPCIPSTTYNDGNQQLIDFSGLGSLASIGGNMKVAGNFALVNFTGLEQLQTITGYLTVYTNTSLSDFTGLQSLSSIGGLYTAKSFLFAVSIGYGDCYAETYYPGDELQSFSGLDNLTTVTGDFYIMGNNFTNLNGLQNLTSIGGDLRLMDVSSLISLDGLENLSSIQGSLNISPSGIVTFGTNSNLIDISALSNLTTVEGEIIIEYNSNLPSLAGLDNVDYTNIDNLTITYNSNLTMCSVSSICNYLVTENPNFYISFNDPGCDNWLEIQALCPSEFCQQMTTTIDTLTLTYDSDLFIDAMGFTNNPSITLTDNNNTAGAILSDISLEVYFRLNGSSCENEITIQLTDPAGNTQVLNPYLGCNGGTDLYYTNIPISTAPLTGSPADWLIEFNDTNNQNSDHEYSVRYAQLNYIATTTTSILPSLLIIDDQPIPNGTYQAIDEIDATGTVLQMGNVNFKAGQLILLDEGFSVDVNADFSATIEECDEN